MGSVSRLVALLGACAIPRDLPALWRIRAAGHTGGASGTLEHLHPKALGGTAVAMRPGTTDFVTFRATFTDRFHVPPAEVGECLSVLDLGANVGYTAADLCVRHPGARILAVEMDEENLRCAERNTEPWKDRITCVHAAVWTDDAGVSYAPDRDADAFCVGDPSEDACVSVPSRTVGQLIEELSVDAVDFVKMDIEGAERQVVLDGDTPWLDQVRSLNVEIHDRELLEPIHRKLESHGFVVRRSAAHWSSLEAYRRA